MVAAVFATGGSIMVATSWFVDTSSHDGWMWTGIAVLAASVWTYLVRDTGRDSIHRREADTEASTPTDSNISV